MAIFATYNSRKNQADKKCRPHKVWLLGGSILALALPCGTGALAQDNSEDTRTVRLEELVVTATRQAVNIQNVPVSVQAVTGESLAASNITDAGQLTAIAPSLQLTGNSSGRGSTQFAIRGIGTNSFLHSLELSVSTVIDGVPMGRSELGFTDFNDIERIEVLSGPQGMLFGKNATAGVINIVSQRPKMGVVEGNVNLSYGILDGTPTNAKKVIAQGTVNVPVSDTIALRVSGSYTDHGALLTHINPHPHADIGKAQKSVKARLLWDVTDNLSMYFVADYADINGLGTGLANDRGFYWGGDAQQDPGFVTGGPQNTVTTAGSRVDMGLEVGGVSSEIVYAFDSGYTLTNITAWRKYTGQVWGDNDGFALNHSVFVAMFDFEQFSNEFRIESPQYEHFKFQSGLYYFAGHYNRSGDNTEIGLGSLPAVVPGFERNTGGRDDHINFSGKSYAFYTEATISATDSLRFVLGGRLTHDKTSIDTGIDYRFTFDPPAAAGRTLIDSENSDSETDFSYRVGVQYDLTDDVMTYATYSRGYKGGGYNFYNPNPNISGRYLEPEIAKVYEVGLKSTLFDRVRANIALFYGKYNNFQAQGYDPNVEAFIITNAGSLETKGVEFQLQAELAADLSFSGNVAYVDAIYKDFPGSACYGGQTVAQGCIGGFFDASGQQLTNSPKWSGNANLTYTPSLTDRFDGIVRAEFTYRGPHNFAVTGHDATQQKSYGLFNAYVGVNDTVNNWEINVFCKNCFDTRFVNYISPVQALSRSYRQNFSVDSFREIGVRLKANF